MTESIAHNTDLTADLGDDVSHAERHLQHLHPFGTKLSLAAAPSATIGRPRG